MTQYLGKYLLDCGLVAAGALVAGVLLPGAPEEAPEAATEELLLAHRHSIIINTRGYGA